VALRDFFFEKAPCLIESAIDPPALKRALCPVVSSERLPTNGAQCQPVILNKGTSG